MDSKEIKIQNFCIINDSKYPEPANEHDIKLMLQMGAIMKVINVEGKKNIIYFCNQGLLERLHDACRIVLCKLRKQIKRRGLAKC